MSLFDESHGSFGVVCQKYVEDAKFNSGAAKYLSHMERFWHIYKPYASPDFQRQLLADDGKFFSLTWEMMLAVMLLDKGYQLEPSKDDNRPDLCLIFEGKKIWIECCLPTGGDPSKPNSVVEIVSDGEFHRVDLDKSILRCVQQLSGKKLQHQKWVERAVCKQNEPFVIALNGRYLRLSIYNSSLPHILRALYGTGNLYAVFDSKDMDRTESGYLFTPTIEKSERTAIPTTFFLEKDNDHISGVLFSNDWIQHYSSSPQYCYVENINATSRTRTSFSEFCQTYKYEENSIRLRDVSLF